MSGIKTAYDVGRNKFDATGYQPSIRLSESSCPRSLCSPKSPPAAKMGLWTGVAPEASSIFFSGRC